MGIPFSFLLTLPRRLWSPPITPPLLAPINREVSCESCLQLCPVCFDFMNQKQHAACSVWFQTQSAHLQSIGQDWYMRFSFQPSALRSRSSNACKCCDLILQSLLHYGDDWEDPRWNARLVASHIVQVSILEGNNTVLSFDLDIHRGKFTFSAIFDSPNVQLPGHRTEDARGIEDNRDSSVPTSTNHVSEDFLQKECVEKVKGWIQTCINSHPKCSLVTNAKLPTRVINIGAGDIFNNIFLHEPDKTTDDSEYVALSHSWGGAQPLTTTLTTIEIRKAGIQWLDLPKTFQDAVQITRALGYRYLWIDSLCIIQDSEEDWQKEGARMALTYGESALTIVASESLNSQSGFISKRQVHNLFYTDEGGIETQVQVRKPCRHSGYWYNTLPNEMFPTAPIYLRAWCFQERLLPPRALHFLSNEVIFECNTHCACECGLADKFEGMQLLKSTYARSFEAVRQNKITPSDHFEVWKNIVQTYSSRNLTFGRDKLPALSGLAQAMSYSGRFTYVAGLWREQLAEGLTWSHVGSARRDTAAGSSRLGEYVAPTFSWASVSGEVAWRTRGPHQTVEILEVACSLAGHDPCGQVTSGYIWLKGRLLPCKIKDKADDPVQFHQIDLGGWPYVDSRDDAAYGTDVDAFCLELFHSEDEDNLMPYSIALLLTKYWGDGTYGQVAFESAQKLSSDTELEMFKKKSCYTRLGLVNMMDPRAFREVPKTELVIF